MWHDKRVSVIFPTYNEKESIRPDSEARPRFDEQDAWLVPTSGLSALTRPGPRIRIYRLSKRGPSAK
jgi:hypothetical protein